MGTGQDSRQWIEDKMLGQAVAQMRWKTLRETGTLPWAMQPKGGSATRVPHVHGAACDRTQNTPSRRRLPRVDIEASAQQPPTISQESDAPRGGRAIASRLIEARSFESNHEVLETGPNSDTVDCVQGTMFIDSCSIGGSELRQRLALATYGSKCR